MKIKLKVFFSLFILICFFSISSSSLLAAQMFKTTDVPSYTKVNNTSEFKEVLQSAINTLQPKIILNAPHSDLDTYSKVIELFPEVKSYHLTLSKSYKGSTLTVILEIKQAYKIFNGLKNTTAYSRLTDSDLNLLKLAKNIVADNTSADMSDFEKELSLHNYIINTTSYDYERLSDGTLPDVSYSAAGALIHKVAVCEGYSEATKLLLNLAGIDCEIVYGSTTTSPSHAWNIVKINNDWYMLDTTFDDPITLNNNIRFETISYEYFNVTSSTLKKDHTWDATKWPAAVSTAYNYFVYYHKVVHTYEEFKDYIIKEIHNGERNLECYVYGYSPSTYSFNFIFNYYKGKISYSIPSGTSGTIRIRLS